MTLAVYLSYVHRPTAALGTALQLAFVEHWASPARREASSMLGEQMRAQYFSLLEESCRAHSGSAVTPAGTSLGHLVLKMPVHLGEQKEPVMPLTEMSNSSLWQPPSLGSS